jgi:hypothetical protein
MIAYLSVFWTVYFPIVAVSLFVVADRLHRRTAPRKEPVAASRSRLSAVAIVPRVASRLSDSAFNVGYNKHPADYSRHNSGRSVDTSAGPPQ